MPMNQEHGTMEENGDVVCLPADIERLRRAIVQYVDQNDLKILFWDMHNPLQNMDESLCIQATRLFKKKNDREQKHLVNQLIYLVQQSRSEPNPTNVTYERVIDSILRYSMKEGVLPASSAIGGIILTADFTLKTGLCPIKWKLLLESIDNMDLKGIRHVFKTLADSQLALIPPVLSIEQRQQLIPIENFLLHILNKVPPIFTMTEIARSRTLHLYIFPRVVEKISEIKAYFRPLADLSFAVGRCFMYPILAHPQFLHLSASWRVDNNSTALCGRFTYLPNRKEVSAPQNYLFYMVIKQPRGKDTVMSMLRSLQSSAQGQSFDCLLSLLISDTMAAVEELPPGVDIPRYQWDNLLTIIIYGMNGKHTNVSNVVGMLHSILEKRQYRRARDEVMWLMLQVAGSFLSILTMEHVEKLAALYRLLYNEEVSMNCVSDHPSEFVRFLSTACMFILLEGKEGLPEPSNSLAGQIRFIQESADKDTLDIGTMAALANSYQSSSQIVKRVHKLLNSLLDGHPSEEPFYLPYNKVAHNRLNPFRIQDIDSFTLRAKLHLLNQVCDPFKQREPQRFLSPARIDSYARILYTMDSEFGLKSFTSNFSSVAKMISTNNAQANDHIYIIVDMLCNRLTNVALPAPIRQSLALNTIAMMHYSTVQSFQASVELYSICEQALMRMFSWGPFSEIRNLGCAFLQSDRSVSSYLCVPSKFQIGNAQEDSSNFHVCPEVVRMLFITHFRTVKIMALDFNDDLPFYQRLMSIYPWSHSQLQSFPPECASLIDPNTVTRGTSLDDHIKEAIRSDYVKVQAMHANDFMEYMGTPQRQPTILCVIYRHLMMKENIYMVMQQFYMILNRATVKELMVSVNWLVDYVIQQCSEEHHNQEIYKETVETLLKMMFELYVMKFDRLLLSLVLHPDNDEKSQIALFLVHNLLESKEIKDRIKTYCDTVPRKEVMPERFFKKLGDFHKLYPEYTFVELAGKQQGDRHPNIIPDSHPPIYYGSLIERLLPIADYTLTRALEISMADTTLSSIIISLAPLYKYHPSPITFVYSVLHSLHNHLGNLARARQLVINIFGHIDKMHLTQLFVEYNHQKINSYDDVMTELIQRIIECSDFVLTPPPYVSSDWRFSELSPGAQALYLSCIELLASPQGPQVVVKSMISVLCSSKQVQSRPFSTLNAVALLLTALPEAYGQVLQKEFVDVLESGVVNDLNFIDIVYDNFEENIHLHMTNRSMIVNTLMQAYWIHGNQLGITRFSHYFIDQVYPHIKTEKELWYFVRLMLPLQQWVFEKDKIKQLFPECIKQVQALLKKLGELSEAGVEFEHGQVICDIFYHLKYMFSGDSMSSDAEKIFPKLPADMQEHLKYYITTRDEEHMDKSSVVPNQLPDGNNPTNLLHKTSSYSHDQF